jgi:hypothetical protein
MISCGKVLPSTLKILKELQELILIDTNMTTRLYSIESVHFLRVKRYRMMSEMAALYLMMKNDDINQLRADFERKTRNK